MNPSTTWAGFRPLVRAVREGSALAVSGRVVVGPVPASPTATHPRALRSRECRCVTQTVTPEDKSAYATLVAAGAGLLRRGSRARVTTHTWRASARRSIGRSRVIVGGRPPSRLDRSLRGSAPLSGTRSRSATAGSTAAPSPRTRRRKAPVRRLTGAPASATPRDVTVPKTTSRKDQVTDG